MRVWEKLRDLGSLGAFLSWGNGKSTLYRWPKEAESGRRGKLEERRDWFGKTDRRSRNFNQITSQSGACCGGRIWIRAY